MFLEVGNRIETSLSTFSRVGFGRIACLSESKCTASHYSPFTGSLGFRFSICCWTCVSQYGVECNYYTAQHPSHEQNFSSLKSIDRNDWRQIASSPILSQHSAGCGKVFNGHNDAETPAFSVWSDPFTVPPSRFHRCRHHASPTAQTPSHLEKLKA